jgi:phenylacetate-CoA ligase
MMKNRIYYYNSELDNLSQEEITLLQEKKLRKQLKYCHDNSSFYRKKFKDAGVNVEDVRTLEDLRRLPIFLTKDIERQSAAESLETYGHPFGMHLCCPVEDVTLVGTTSGTTGIPTFSYIYTRKDVATILENGWSRRFKAVGIQKGDRVAFFFALGVYATTGSLYALRAVGALPIDIDARAGTDMLLQFIDLTRPSYLACTPSLAEFLIDRCPKVLKKDVGDLKFKGLLTTGEIGIAIPEIKRKLEEAYGCRAYDYWAPEAHAMGMSCDSEDYHGMHALCPDLCTSYDDLVDPITKEPVDITDGATGEMVHTSLEREACPIIRYAYGDIVQIFTKECPACGFPGKRIKLIGRSDDMLIVKGVNIYPAAIKDIVSSFIPDVTGKIRVVLDNPPPRVVPPLKLKIEHGEGIGLDELKHLSEKIAKTLHEKIKLRPEIQLVPPGTFPPESRKTPIFEKNYGQAKKG